MRYVIAKNPKGRESESSNNWKVANLCLILSHEPRISFKLISSCILYGLGPATYATRGVAQPRPRSKLEAPGPQERRHTPQTRCMACRVADARASEGDHQHAHCKHAVNGLVLGKDRVRSDSGGSDDSIHSKAGTPPPRRLRGANAPPVMGRGSELRCAEQEVEDWGRGALARKRIGRGRQASCPWVALRRIFQARVCARLVGCWMLARCVLMP